MLGIPPPTHPPLDRWLPARRRLLSAIFVGVLAVVVISAFAAWQITALIAWCSAAGTFAGITGVTILSADSERTRMIATRDDDTRVTADLTIIVASIASLVGVGFLLLKASATKGLATAAMTGLGVVSVVLAWCLVHVTFTLRYADLYFSEAGGIDFNGDEAPDYRDFAYLAFTIGMTYQVSDTALSTKVVRRTALRHALLSYVFGTAIIAITISTVAGIAR